MSTTPNAAPAATPAATGGDLATPTDTSAEAINAVADEMLDSAEDAEEGEEAAEEIKAEEEKKKKEEAKAAKKTAEAKKKLKLKVNGKELEEEVDVNDDERLTRAFQKEKAFDAASQELAQIKKQFSGFIETLKGGQVMDVLRELGHNPDELAEKHIEKLVEQAKKSPEQVEKEQMAAELKRLKEEKELLSKEKEEKDLEAIRNQHAAEIENDISEMLDKAETILPKRNPKIIRSIAANMLFAMQNGYPDVTAKEIIPLVEAEYKKDLKELFDVLPEDTIEMLVGKNNFDRVRKKRISNRKVQTQTPNQIVKETGEKKPEGTENTSKKNYKNFFSYRD